MTYNDSVAVETNDKCDCSTCETSEKNNLWKLEEEIKELSEKRERALDESEKLLERYAREKLQELPEASLRMKRKADMLKAEIDVKRRRLDVYFKKHFEN